MRQLNQKFGTLYHCLYIKHTGKWLEDDIEGNYGSFVSSSDQIPGDMRELVDRLATPKQYKVREAVK